ncbi:MAG: hypothetical protein ACT4OG_04610 [Alphaproteobacteria bacterium]
MKRLILLLETVRMLAFNVRLAAYLGPEGFDVAVVTPARKRVRLYEKAGISCIHLDAVSAPNDVVARGAILAMELEKRFADFDLDLAIARDRFLRWWPRRRWTRRIQAALARFDDLLRQLWPVLVVGEISTSLEYALYFLCTSRGIPYRVPLNMPGEEALFALFDHEHSAKSTLYPGDQHAAPVPLALNYYDLCRKERSGGKLNHVRLVFRDLAAQTYAADDYRTHHVYKLRYFLKILYAPFYWLLERLFARTRTEGTVLLALHVQPEATPDYVAIHWADQLRLAEDVADSLPPGMRLFVKEHPDFFCIRPPWRFIKLLLRPNVSLAPRKADLRAMLPKLDCLVTIAGTAALEATRFGTPTVIYSNAYIRELPNVVDGRAYRNFAEARRAAKSLAPPRWSAEELRRFCRRMAMPGMIYDFVVAPEVLSDVNIAAIAAGYARYARSLTQE